MSDGGITFTTAPDVGWYRAGPSIRVAAGGRSLDPLSLVVGIDVGLILAVALAVYVARRQS